MKAKKIPLRKCTGCGEMFDKRTLVRVVKSPDGEVSLDLTGKASGRGAYICNSTECLKQAQKKKSLERSLKTDIPENVYQELEKEMSEHENG